MAGFPSMRRPLGNLPSGEMFLILRIISCSSLRTENILLTFATDYILPLISCLFLTFAYSVYMLRTSGRLTFSWSFSSKLEHFFTIVYSMLETFSARNGSDHENTFSPSGSR